jgi:PDZ domain-containing secreted protein
MTIIRWVSFGIVIVAGTLQLSAQQPSTAAQAPFSGVIANVGADNPLSATVRPNAVGTIQGNALNSTNGQLANVTVRLRDTRFGRIIQSQVTDQSGIFTFKNIDPGSYIVEMMGTDDTILAASEVLNINAGEAVSAVVKLPFRVPPFANAIGASTPNAASAIVTAAAAGGLMVVTAVGDPTCFQ